MHALTGAGRDDRASGGTSRTSQRYRDRAHNTACADAGRLPRIPASPLPARTASRPLLAEIGEEPRQTRVGPADMGFDPA
jgi:hypothetical protein